MYDVDFVTKHNTMTIAMIKIIGKRFWVELNTSLES